MDAVAATLAGRRAAERTLTDRIKVTRAGGKPVTDPYTGVVTFPEATVWEGKARVQITAPAAETSAVAGAIYTIQAAFLHVPVGAGPFKIDDQAEITASPLDPHRVGRRLRITGLHEKTHAVLQRLKIEQITG